MEEKEREIYDEELHNAFRAYAKVKYDQKAQDKDLDKWYEDFANATFDLYEALAKGTVSAIGKVFFYNNIAQCAFRKGRKINFAELADARKVEFEPGYLSTRTQESGEVGAFPLGLRSGEIEDFCKKYPSLKSFSVVVMPFKIFYELGLKDGDLDGLGDAKAFLLDEGDTCVLSIEQCRQIAEGEMDRQSFVKHTCTVIKERTEQAMKEQAEKNSERPNGSA